jgi:hypothetical protein
MIHLSICLRGFHGVIPVGFSDAGNDDLTCPYRKPNKGGGSLRVG